MKKLFIFIFFSAAMIMLQPGQSAATECVSLNSSTTCSTTQEHGTVDWTATCGGIPISGAGVCSSTNGLSIGQTADTIATVYTTETAVNVNKYCWCKMTSPAVSRFVFAHAYSLAEYCSHKCAYGCVHGGLIGSAVFRAALFSELTD